MKYLRNREIAAEFLHTLFFIPLCTMLWNNVVIFEEILFLWTYRFVSQAHESEVAGSPRTVHMRSLKETQRIMGREVLYRLICHSGK